MWAMAVTRRWSGRLVGLLAFIAGPDPYDRVRCLGGFSAPTGYCTPTRPARGGVVARCASRLPAPCGCQHSPNGVDRWTEDAFRSPAVTGGSDGRSDSNAASRGARPAAIMGTHVRPAGR